VSAQLVGLVTTTAAGRAAAARLAQVLPGTRTYDVRQVGTAFAECDGLVCFLATGATVRLLAPLLQDKASDPGVVVVDEAQRFAVALLGGHGGGANALAQQVADALGATAVITTATDAAGLPGLDTLGWPVEGAVAAVSRAMLDGEPVRLDADAVWPLPALPAGDAGEHVLRVTDRAVEPDPRVAVLRPPSLVLGIGASRACPPTRC
jgi:cobalt-precorrin 5A hydrolase/precorrin-3B C17-methyltransferase